MKQGNLLLSTLLSLFLTGFVLTHSAWLPHTSRSPLRRGEPHLHARANDPLMSDAGRRWRTCQPNHWRGYMLQR